MKLATFRTNYSVSRAVLAGLFAVVLCGGGLHGMSLLTAAPGTIALSCNTLTGPGAAATIVVKPAATLTGNTLTNNSIAVTLSASIGLVMTPPSPAILNS